MTVLQIGITGGIGSGKSLVCRIFSRLGIPVYDADSRAKALMTTDAVLLTSIRKEFGEQSFDGETLNRTYLAREVFSNPSKLERLNALVHPRVALDYENWAKSYDGSVPYVLKEAALLYESGSYAVLDKIIVVSASLETRIQRVLKRDPQRSREQILQIINRQLPEEEKLKRADKVINNDGTELVIPQVLALHQEFRALVH